MKIGIFDSGIGGLSVLYEAMQLLPHEQFIYYADEKHVPYGEKTREEIIGYVDEIIQFMIDHDCKAIVIACNTATSAAVALMRKKYDIPIIGMEPAVKKAVDLYGNQKVLVCATPITVKGKKMLDLVERVDKDHLVDLVALPKLVRFAEKQEFNSDEEYYLGPIVTFKNENNKKEVIDGQQRLTTLMLLLRAFYVRFSLMKTDESMKTRDLIAKCIGEQMNLEQQI